MFIYWTDGEHAEKTYSIQGISNKLATIGRYFTDFLNGLPEVIIFQKSNMHDVGDIFGRLHKVYGGSSEAVEVIRQIRVYLGKENLDWQTIEHFLNFTRYF